MITSINEALIDVHLALLSGWLQWVCACCLQHLAIQAWREPSHNSFAKAKLWPQVYKARDCSRTFAIEHYKTLLDTLALLQPSNTHGLGAHEARLLFFWSQSVVRDELKSRQRSTSLLFCDFVEVSTACRTYGDSTHVCTTCSPT